MTKNLPLLKSDSKFLLFWDFLMLLLIILFIFAFSTEFFFDMDMENEFPLIVQIKIFSCIFFFSNMFIRMNTEYYECGFCVKERKKIIINYAKNLLLWDLISMTSLIMSFFEETAVYYYKILFLCTYFSFRELYKNLKEQRITNDYLEMCLLLFRLICISHLIACLWHGIAYYNIINVPEHWLDSFYNYGWHKRYVASIYWAIATLCTVGYGDITPKNFLEMGFCSCVMLIGTLVFGYSINSIGLLINRMDQRKKELNEKMIIIDHFLNKGNIKEDLKFKVKNYLQYIWRSDDKNLEKLRQLSKHCLRKEILYETIAENL